MQNATTSLVARLSQPDVQAFLWDNALTDEHELVLKQKEILGVPTALIANQIKCRRKAQQKLPTWFQTRGIVYPPSLNLEQSSSEATALFKQKLIASLNVTSLADLTGGFGVDSFWFSKSARVDFVEPNEELLALAQHNHLLLGTRITYYGSTAENFLARSGTRYDLIYVDPSRRTESKGRVFKLADGEPNVVRYQAQLFEKADQLLIKASPLLDVQQGLRELSGVKSVYVVAVDNECKELLFHCQKNFAGDPLIQCANLSSANLRANTDIFSFLLADERNTQATFSAADTFLFEPHAAILKGGAFKTVSTRYALAKLDPNTHLYTAPEPIENFPGKIFRISEAVKPDKKLVQKFEGGYANILIRNYPLSVEALKKKTGLKEGGTLFLIGATCGQQKHLWIAQRIK